MHPILANPFELEKASLAEAMAIVPPRVMAAAMPEIETAHAAASYRAKDMASWIPQRMSPDSSLLAELDTINARGDDLARNNGVAAPGMTSLDNGPI